MMAASDLIRSISIDEGKISSSLGTKLNFDDEELLLDDHRFETGPKHENLKALSANHINHKRNYHKTMIGNNPHEKSGNHINNTNKKPKRRLNKLIRLMKNLDFDRSSLTNEELVYLVKKQHLSIYQLENFLGKENAARCVEIRREFYRSELAELDRKDQSGIRDRAKALDISREDKLNYELVNGACCENVIGHVKIPVGLAGPLILDGEEIFVPLATTEGCLVASTCRGLSALRKSGGVISRISKDCMTRAPIIRFQDSCLKDAIDNVQRAIDWLNQTNNKEKMRAAFNLTSSHGKLLDYTIHAIGREIHIRFEAYTGDAMGMNMCSKGVDNALKEMQRSFPTMKIVTLSGNMCTDKKATAINWVKGRGKSVECNAEIPSDVVEQVFKVSVDSMINVWRSKVMIGSALSATIGGYNCQAANILTAIFIATGQDPAQNVTSSNCILTLEKDSQGSLIVCCSMPSIECGTVGGGTILDDQCRYLQLMGVRGSTQKPLQNNSSSKNNSPQTSSIVGDLGNVDNNSHNAITHNINGYTNARKLARIICATVMAGELSLLASLSQGTLVKSHLRLNRSSTTLRPVCHIN